MAKQEEYTLKTRPDCDWIIHQPRNKKRIDDAYCTIVDAERWFEGFAKKISNIDSQKWFEENVYEDWTWEGMLAKFIEKEILGER